MLSRSYGAHLRNIEVDGLAITESLRSPNEVLALHSHEFTNIMLVLGGRFQESVGKTQTDCAPNSIVIRPAGESHTDRYGAEGAHCLIIEVLPPRLKMLVAISSLLRDAVHVHAPSLRFQIGRLYQEMRIKDSASLLAIDSLLLEILSRLSRTRDSHNMPGWLARADDYLHDQYRNQLHLSDIAKEAGVHPTHLSRAYSKHFHLSIGEAIRNLRLEFSAIQLVTSELSLAEIALSAGFYDQSHFSRMFKLRYGLTPREYRSDRKPNTRTQ